MSWLTQLWSLSTVEISCFWAKSSLLSWTLERTSKRKVAKLFRCGRVLQSKNRQRILSLCAIFVCSQFVISLFLEFWTFPPFQTCWTMDTYTHSVALQPVEPIQNVELSHQWTFQLDKKFWKQLQYLKSLLNYTSLWLFIGAKWALNEIGWIWEKL